MKQLVNGCLVLVALVAVVLAAPGLAQTRAKAQNVPEIPFESVPNFLKMPADVYLGESMGVATNSKGHVFVYHRRDDTRLFEFDPNGTFVKEWGRASTGSSSPTRCASTRTTTSGSSTRGRTWSSSSTPRDAS